ncbi:putative RDD family membrane protein YckC [Sphingomonas trueperi]|uniref:RDD family protein n=1 Tax=Sphingomonas trueperi TaxID=53317 RepID=UPI00339B1927
MRLPFRAKRAPKPASRRRSFVTPEGVDLGLELARPSARATAFAVDSMIMLIVLILAAVGIGLLRLGNVGLEAIAVLWLLGAFVLRNGWFVLFEMGSRGATPGKRLMKLRVVARDGGRLTGAAVIARNAMREIELFLPLSFLGAQRSAGLVDGALTGFALLWTGLFLLFPLFNRDGLRAGDLIAGTWVVNTVRGKLHADLAAADAQRPRRTFSAEALDLYGVFELQKLEDVLRRANEEAIVTVAATIRRKAGLPDDGDDLGFLTDYYAALCARLERGMMLGKRRDDKHSGWSRR